MDKTYIIAEMAYSHDGSVELANQIVRNAADAGADAISIHITHMPTYMVKHYRTGKGRVSAGKEIKPLYQYLVEISPSFEDWKKVVKEARKVGLDLIIMPNDLPSLEFSKEFSPEAYVLSAACFEEYDFIRVVGRCKRPVYLRVGGAMLGEIEKVIHLLRDEGNEKITLLYGYQNYPTGIEDSNLKFLSVLKQAFQLPVGLADHLDADDDFATIVPLLAMVLDISCIEKHMTHDRSKKGEDFESALDKDEFKLMVERVRKAEKALKDVLLFELTEASSAYRQNIRKRVVAAKKIKAGEVITRDKIICKRSDEGVFPSNIDVVCGMVAKRNIEADEGIDLAMFQKNGDK